MKLLITFFLLIVPLIEIGLLIQLSRIMPVISIFLVCGITALLGLWLMRNENYTIWTLIESDIQNQRLPSEEILNDFLVWFSGLILLLPGLLTDGLGIMLIFPEIRKTIIEATRKFLKNKFQMSP
ncbi:MAG: FxsA family protein [SAR324 cluster bacterium]|nr:FxsA family protein [SAR324 cluster bacterium]